MAYKNGRLRDKPAYKHLATSYFFQEQPYQEDAEYGTVEQATEHIDQLNKILIKRGC